LKGRRLGRKTTGTLSLIDRVGPDTRLSVKSSQHRTKYPIALPVENQMAEGQSKMVEMLRVLRQGEVKQSVLRERNRRSRQKKRRHCGEHFLHIPVHFPASPLDKREDRILF
jgi:hypothetical protein